MRKKIIDQTPPSISSADEDRLDLSHLAQIEISSEDTAFPIEEALEASGSTGWRASEAGEQTIRIIFDEPQHIHRIHLRFEEQQQARNQEFVLRWSPDKEPLREIVRQQYNFSPESSTQEHEDYTLNLEDVKVVELSIIPEMGGGDARATLARLWMD